MPEHVVIEGECLSSIARKYGFPNWSKIYHHPSNAAFRQKRPNPNLLYPGDLINIPDKQEKQENRPTGNRHLFQLMSPKVLIRIALRDERDVPMSCIKYALTVGDKHYEGSTGDDGMLEHKISALEEDGKLTIWPGEGGGDASHTWALKIGHLDPVEEMTGIQGRLNNIAYDCGPVDGICGPRTKAAVREFQRANGLKVDGIPGSKTQAALKEAYGC